MSKQMKIEDITPNAALNECEDFMESLYEKDAQTAELQDVNTRFEAYGVIAASFQNVEGAIATIKSDMKDCLKALTVSDDAFQAAINTLNASLVEMVTGAAGMYEHGRSISQTMSAWHLAANPAPLLDMIEEDDMPGDDSEDVEE